MGHNDDQIRGARELLQAAVHVAVMSGAGVSAESGVATFRGATSGGLWRGTDPTQIASPTAWQRNPGLVWEFYNYRRRLMADKQPNPAHHALARLEHRMTASGRSFRLITQNIDDLHLAAGSQTVTRLHGSIWKVRCDYCHEVSDNRDVPITPAFEGNDGPEEGREVQPYTHDDFPLCRDDRCRGKLRPHVVWFGETLDEVDLAAASHAANHCDVFLIVGTSALVYPAAMFAPLAQARGAKLIEVNLEATPMSSVCEFAFQGKAGEILPLLID